MKTLADIPHCIVEIRDILNGYAKRFTTPQTGMEALDNFTPCESLVQYALRQEPDDDLQIGIVFDDTRVTVYIHSLEGRENSARQALSELLREGGGV